MTGLRHPPKKPLLKPSLAKRRIPRTRILQSLTISPPFAPLPPRAPDGTEAPPHWLSRLAAFIGRIFKRVRPTVYGPHR